MTPRPTLLLSVMSLSARLIALRKEKGFTQQALADQIGLHVNQIKRYEAGSTQPSLDALKKLAQVLSVTTDFLLFEDAERGPDETLKLKFEAIKQFDRDERRIAEGVLDSLIVQHQAKRLFGRHAAETDTAKPAVTRTEPIPASRGRAKPRAAARAGS